MTVVERHGRSRFGLLALLSVVCLLLAAVSALAAPKFPALTGRVVDGAGVLSPQTEAALTGELADLEARTGRQVVVATIPDLQGYEIEDFGYQLGRAWGIGAEDRDDGAVFLIAPRERKVRIEVGYGLEPVLTDALSSVILQQEVLPAFRDGRMEEGIVAGTRAVIRQLALPDDQAQANVAQAVAPQSAGSDGWAPAVIFLIFFVIWMLGGVLRVFGARRRGGLWWLPLLLSSGGSGRGSRGWSGGGGGGGWGGGGGGFSGGGGSFGGGGSSGSW